MEINTINTFTVIVIAGPTAVGKTDVAIKLAQQLNCDIINADSRQLYHEISIGTAKPTTKQLLDVRHHFVNSHSINDIFTAGDFEKEAMLIIENEIKKNKKTIVVCGGTGMYINALINGLDELPSGNEAIRKNLHEIFLRYGIEYLQYKLQELDFLAFEKIEKENPQRLMRAIEVCLVTGNKYSNFLIQKKKVRPFETIKIALNLEREILYNKINKRVDDMMLDGLENEAQLMLPFKNKYALKTVGYNELFDFFENNISKANAIELIKQHTRNYAKRQITWFKKDKEYCWFSPNNFDDILQFISNKLS